MQKNDCLKLRECPFCGGEAKVAKTELEGFEIRCTKCPCDFGRFWFVTEVEAVEAWNRRAGEDGKHEAD